MTAPETVEGLLPFPGDALQGSLLIPKAQALRQYLESSASEFARFVEARTSQQGEVLVFEVEVELGQISVHPIQRKETLSVEFFRDDNRYPEVLSLRPDFPEVPHLNLKNDPLPRSLCLYEQPYDEIKLNWTPARFVERVRWWLAKTAKGKLHQDDQPLEPILLGHTGHIVLPEWVTQPGPEGSGALWIREKVDQSGYKFLLAAATPEKAMRGGGSFYVGCVFQTAPVTHGVIHQLPVTLSALHDFLSRAGLDLAGSLRNQLKDDFLELDGEAHKTFQARLILVIRLPKKREEQGQAETVELIAFSTEQSVLEVGTALDAWNIIDGKPGLQFTPDTSKTGDNITLRPLNCVHEFRPDWAARMNGFEENTGGDIFTVGCGALGSQVVMNLARAGFGDSWTLVDEDRLFPHNLARHFLGGNEVGDWKAEKLAEAGNALFPSAVNRFTAINANLLSPGRDKKEIEDSLHRADRIVDLSASVSVARSLTHRIESGASRCSAFLSPLGQDLVFLDEGLSREVPLDALEMQYYRAVATNEELSGHLQTRDRNRTRYGQSCRDVTFQVSQENMAIHAALAARAIRTSEDRHESRIQIWRAEEDGSVQKVEPDVYPTVRLESNSWTVVIDEYLLSKISELRQSRLPNETGGVLIGSFDMEFRIAYLVDTIPSPEDSEEWPTLYIRGCKGLRKKTEEISEQTNHILHYVGEWHSHPDGCRTRPSEDDLKVFAWLTERMHDDGFPALMLIAGEKGATSCFVGEIQQVENLFPLIPHE